MKKRLKFVLALGLAAILAAPTATVFAEATGQQSFQDKGAIQLTYSVVETPQTVTVPVQLSSVNTGVHVDKVLSNISICLTCAALLILLVAQQKSRQEEDSW